MREKIAVGEKLICLKNNRRRMIFNGMMFTVAEVNWQDEESICCDLIDDVGEVRDEIVMFKPCIGGKPAGVEVPRDQEQFDYGYCITAHKAQGSEWNRVMVLDQPCRNWSMERWRYTAFTRAREHLTVII